VDAFSIEGGFEEAGREAERHATTFWSGEWGWFGDPTTQGARVAEYARNEDRHLVGGAWWQWKQACGDPHNLGADGAEPPRVSVGLVRLDCPSGRVLGVPEPFRRVLGRAYPRAAPGALRELSSDPTTGALTVSGFATRGGTLDVWLPPGPRPRATGSNVTGIQLRSSSGGYRLRAQAKGDYALRVTRVV
jgi:endoglycosylceramidase